MKNKIYKRIAVMAAATVFTTTIPVMASDIFGDSTLEFYREEVGFVSDLSDGKPEGSVPEFTPEGNAPDGKPEEDTPEVKPEGNAPDGKPEGNTPEVKPEGNAPDGKPEGNTPEVKPEGNAPDGKPEENNPEVKPEENIPEENVPEETPAPNEQIITVEKNISKTYGDGVFFIKATCLGDAPLTFESKNPEVVEVSPEGRVKIRKAGNAVIIVSAKACGEYPAASEKITIKINRKQIKNLRVVFGTTKEINTNKAGHIEKLLVVWDGKKIVSDKNVKIVIKKAALYPNTLRYVSGYIEGRGNYTGKIRFDEVWTISKRSEIEEIVNTSKGPLLTWKEENGAVGYVIYRKTGNGKFKRVKVIKDYEVTSWKDTQRAGAKDATYYYIMAYGKNRAGKTIYNKRSEVEIIPGMPVISKIQKYNRGIKISIKGDKASTGYQIQRYERGRWKDVACTKKSVYVDNDVSSKVKKIKYRVRAYIRKDFRLTFSHYSPVKAIKR